MPAALLLIAALAGCSTDRDCHMAGQCISGTCKCEAGWTGEDCGLLNLGVAYNCSAGGLCMHGELDNKATWGGNVVKGDDGKYHMYSAMFPNSTLSTWLLNSRVVHAVADEWHGPYRATDIALGPRGDENDTYWDSLTQHNPEVHRAPDGTYLLYYMGSQINGPPSVDQQANCAVNPGPQSVCNQRVGLATASSPSGPWTRRDDPILEPGPNKTWDDCFTTNPAAWVFPNGSVLLIYKGRSYENFGVMTTGVAFAEHWSGPYKSTGISIVGLPGNCEDAGFYRSSKMGVYRGVLHCGCSYRYVWSLDAINWEATTPEQPWCHVQLDDGTNMTLNRRERPKFLLDEDGTPIGLFTGVDPAQPTDPTHGTNTFTLASKLN